MALLAGARNEKNSHLSEIIHNRMKKLFPEMEEPIVQGAILLANAYASAGDLEKASNIRRQMHKSSVKNKVGLSWTVTDGEILVSPRYVLFVEE